ncbi:FHA domain-containing protein [Nostoc sp. CHAB 5836]|uniref:FHA domain-containing protein n=1 Tax=Nostoc sp. CHAB 5836 TaxID=2780404 RepID=UPI001E3D45A4|nr:FHA domain-containing protein [Nostoc sp. CHAB 5836]MCC5617349.1 FHA domain-containing protein [Nostoc sp. CHAB 5836]
MTTLISQSELTLQWEDAGELKTHQVSGTVSIGRDPKCDLVLQDDTVSTLHVEIFFNQLQNRFFIRNLRGLQNLPTVDEVLLYPDKEFSLYKGSVICLGKQILKVTDISISGVSNVDATNLKFSPKPDKEKKSSKDISNNNKLWKDATVVVTIITSIFTLGGVILSQNTEKQKIAFEDRKTHLQINAEQEKLKFQVQADKEKMMREILSKKQADAEERYYKHKAEISTSQKENTNLSSNKITLKNNCDKPIRVAANFTALNDIEQTRGWNVISPGGTITPSYFAESETIFLYAEATEDKDHKYEWKGENYREKYTIDKNFDYIADDITILLSEKKERESNKFALKKFYGVNLDFKRITIKTFTCDGGSLQLS